MYARPPPIRTKMVVVSPSERPTVFLTGTGHPVVTSVRPSRHHRSAEKSVSEPSSPRLKTGNWLCLQNNILESKHDGAFNPIPPFNTREGRTDDLLSFSFSERLLYSFQSTRSEALSQIRWRHPPDACRKNVPALHDRGNLHSVEDPETHYGRFLFQMLLLPLHKQIFPRGTKVDVR